MNYLRWLSTPHMREVRSHSCATAIFDAAILLQGSKTIVEVEGKKDIASQRIQFAVDRAVNPIYYSVQNVKITKLLY